MKKIRFIFISTFLLALTIGAVGSFQSFKVVHAQTTGASSLVGYAWSDTIGWISFNGTNPSASYGVNEDSAGNLTGYAWSDNIGWIKFGGLSGFPIGTGTSNENALIDSNGVFHGWALACGGTLPGDCSSMSSRTDGWNGWISLDGTGYGVGLNSVDNTYEGWAWGSDVVGWVNFIAGSSTVPTSCQVGGNCVCAGVCAYSTLSPTISFSIVPGSVATGTVAQLAWSTRYMTSCTKSSYGIGVGADLNWTGLMGSATSSGTQNTSSFNASGTETYNLSCTAMPSAGGQTSTSTVTLTVTGQSSNNNPGNSSLCLSVPSNATLCPSPNSAANGSSNLVGSQSSCPVSGNPICQYYCSTGYHQVGNECIGNGSLNEQ